MKYWELLLTKQRERGKDGLTLPFLIGSQNYLPDTHFKQSIEDLIFDMVSSETFETCIRYCMGTQTFIFEIRKPQNSVYYPTHQNAEQTNLSASISFKKELGDSIDFLIDFLENNFQDKIDAGHFSAVPNTYEKTANWTAFSEDEDIAFIKSNFKFL